MNCSGFFQGSEYEHYLQQDRSVLSEFATGKENPEGFSKFMSIPDWRAL